MAGTVTYTEENLGHIKKIKAAWTASNPGGAVSGSATTEVYTGEVVQIVTVPGTVGDQPTDQYDVTVLDDDGIDVISGAGGNRSNASTEQIQGLTSLGFVAGDHLAVTIANAGNAKKGTVYLYIR